MIMPGEDAVIRFVLTKGMVGTLEILTLLTPACYNMFFIYVAKYAFHCLHDSHKINFS